MKFSFYMFKKICKPFSALFSFFFFAWMKKIFFYVCSFFLLSIKKIKFSQKKKGSNVNWFDFKYIKSNFFTNTCVSDLHISLHTCVYCLMCVCSLSNKMNLFMYNWSVENYISFVCISYIKIICVLSPFMCDCVEFDVSI